MVEARLRKMVEGKLRDERCGIRLWRGTTDLMFVLRQLLERHLEFGKYVYLVFLDLVKAFDKVPRVVIWPIMRWYGVPEKLISIVKAIYRDPVTRIKTTYGLREGFNITVEPINFHHDNGLC